MIAAAVAVHAYEEGGLGAAGLAGVVRMLPTALLAPAISTLVDRWPRRKALLAAFATQAVACAGMAGAVRFGLPLGTVLVLLALEGIASIVIQPATSALAPWLARTPSDLTRANATLALGRALGVFLGPLAAAGLIASTDAGWAYTVAAALMACSFALALRIRVAEPTSPTAALGTFRTELVAGLQVLRHDRAVAAVAAQLAMVQGILRGLFGVLSVVVAVDLLHQQGAASATLQSAIGVGGVIAGGVFVRWMPRRLAGSFSLGITLRALPFLAVATRPSFAVVVGLMIVNGMGNTAMLTSGQTLLQRLVPNDLVGRTLGALGMLTTFGIALGSATAPILLDRAGVVPVLVALGIGYPTVALLAWPAVRRAERRATAHDDDLDLLGAVPFLAALPIVTLDAVAQQVTRRLHPAGEVVTRQGEHGDTFHVLTSGVAEVDVDGLTVRTLAPGSWFGELALLRDSIRTATITMREPGESAVVGRTAFLEALSFGSATAGAVAAVSADYVMPASAPHAAVAQRGPVEHDPDRCPSGPPGAG